MRDFHDKRDKDLQFAENANYTSNEEGMGVSPTQYELQNKMPVRPGVRQRTPQREIPFGDPRAPLQVAIAKITPDAKTKKKTSKSKSKSPRPVKASADQYPSIGSGL